MTVPALLRHSPGSHTHRAGAGFLSAEADADGVPRWLAWCVLVTPFVGSIALILLYVISRQPYYRLLQEDYPVEWLQFTLCLFSSITAAAAAWRFMRAKQYFLAAVLLLVALGAFMLTGEEISWGQRVFAYGTPRDLLTVNAQREANVHNIETGGFSIGELFLWFSFLIGLVGTTLALLFRRPRPIRRIRWLQKLTPPIYTVPAFAAMVLYRPIAENITLSPLDRFQEWVEFSLYSAIAMTVCCVYLRSTRELPLGTEPGAGGVVSAHGTVGPRAWRAPLVVLAVSLVITVVFALLTRHYGITPMNVTR
jgi:hypothetical protein